MERLKNFFNKILNKTGKDREINAGAAWVKIVITFFVGLIAGTVLLIYFKQKLTVTGNIETPVAVEKLNKVQIDSILTDYETKRIELEQLKTTRPAIIDPGL